MLMINRGVRMNTGTYSRTAKTSVPHPWVEIVSEAGKIATILKSKMLPCKIVVSRSSCKWSQEGRDENAHEEVKDTFLGEKVDITVDFQLPRGLVHLKCLSRESDDQQGAHCYTKNKFRDSRSSSPSGEGLNHTNSNIEHLSEEHLC